MLVEAVMSRGSLPFPNSVTRISLCTCDRDFPPSGLPAASLCEHTLGEEFKAAYTSRSLLKAHSQAQTQDLFLVGKASILLHR